MKITTLAVVLLVGIANAQDLAASIDDLLGLPDIQPLILPPVPGLPTSPPANQQQRQDTRQSVAEQGRLLTYPKNTLFYTRAKQGTGFFTFKTEVDSIVKIIDVSTRRLEALFWIRAGTRFDHDYAPDSQYVIYFVQNVRELQDGSLQGEWFGKISEPFFVGNDRRTPVNLGLSSSTHRITPSSAEEFERFSPPKQ